jgi:uncharacterized protein YhfF
VIRLNKEIKQFWDRFLESKGLPKDTTYYEAFYFDTTRESANHLCNLVLEGKKKATASSLYYYQVSGDELPTVGGYSIITDFDSKPYAVIKTTDIHIIPYKDLTFDIVSREGEDDSLASWQEKHRKYFMIDGKETGYIFDEDMPVFFEDFEVVYQEE